jgi:hypothetical protein
LQVINAVNSQPECKNSYDHFVEGMAEFKHVFQEANLVAHDLAREATTHITDILREELKFILLLDCFDLLRLIVSVILLFVQKIKRF